MEENFWSRSLIAIIKTIGYVLGILVVVALVGSLTFHYSCKNSSPVFTSINTAPTSSWPQDIAGYKRTEETTYLTFPEWYLVFNPQEYAAWIAHEKPSQFPYITSIRQLWGSYCTVYGIANTHYPFNPGDQLMIGVIASSFTVEYGAKALWESTIGRVSEWTAKGERTAEDDYLANVAKEYGEFVPFKPFYEFPYGSYVSKMWHEVPARGPHMIRKWERRVAFTLEYGIKSGYSHVILFATRSIYGVADTEVFATVRNTKASFFAVPGVRKVKEINNQGTVIALPHYQGFTDTVPGLARQGLRFKDIAGNDELLVTAIVPEDFNYQLPTSTAIFEQMMVTDPHKKRVALQVPVASLSEIIRALEKAGGKIEHLFDY